MAAIGFVDECICANISLYVLAAGAPVRIVSITSVPQDMVSSITLHNSSLQTVTSVRIGLLFAVPQGCGASPYLGKEEVTDRPVVLRPGETREVSGLGVAYGPVRKIEGEHGGPTLSQITVTGARFEHGEPWFLTRNGQVFDDALLASNVQRSCKHPHDE